MNEPDGHYEGVSLSRCDRTHTARSSATCRRLRRAATVERSLSLYSRYRCTRSNGCSTESLRCCAETQPSHPGSPYGHVTVSVGVAVGDFSCAPEPQVLLLAADEALLQGQTERP